MKIFKKFGVLRFTVNVTSTDSRNFLHVLESNKSLFTILSGPGTVKVVGSGVDKGTSFYLQTITESLDLYYFSEPGTYEIEITEKYNLSRFEMYDPIVVSTEDFKYLTNLQNALVLYGSGLYGKLSDLVKPSLTHYNFNTVQNLVGDLNDLNDNVVSAIFYGSNVTGDLSKFENSQSVVTLAFNGCYNITGNISSLVTIPNLYNVQLAGNNKVYGSLSEFLNNGSLKNPNLKILVLTNTDNIIKNQEDITTLRNLGVQVSV